MRYRGRMIQRRRYKVPTKRATIVLPVDLLAYVEGLAARENMSFSGMIATVIEWHRQGGRPQ